MLKRNCGHARGIWLQFHLVGVLTMPSGRSGVLLAFLPALLLLSAHAGQREVDFPDYPKELLVERGARWKFLGNLMDPNFQHTSLQTNLFSMFSQEIHANRTVQGFQTSCTLIGHMVVQAELRLIQSSRYL